MGRNLGQTNFESKIIFAPKILGKNIKSKVFLCSKKICVQKFCVPQNVSPKNFVSKFFSVQRNCGSKKLWFQYKF